DSLCCPPSAGCGNFFRCLGHVHIHLLLLSAANRSGLGRRADRTWLCALICCTGVDASPGRVESSDCNLGCDCSSGAFVSSDSSCNRLLRSFREHLLAFLARTKIPRWPCTAARAGGSDRFALCFPLSTFDSRDDCV